MQKFTDVNELVSTLKPDYPVYCIRPESIKTSVKFFKNNFPGKVLYAVKTNPNKEVLKHIIGNGIECFDAASINEIQQIRNLKPDAHIYFMHTVKNRNDISEAYFNLSVKDFALDSKDELIKILEATEHAKDLTLYIRISISNEHAEIDLSRKFGAQSSEALGLIRLCKEHANKIGISFHVGSQCMHKISFAKAISEVGNIIKKTKITPDIINVGGGFPSIYPDLNPEPIENYLNEIKDSVAKLNLPVVPKLICEPGRAIVAESGSTIVKVNLRKKNKLYINDGTYGTLFDAGVPNFILPSKIILNGKNQSKKLTAFNFYGPTCDSMDFMKGPFLLPNNIKEGDYIELGQLGAYGLTFRTRFNGFYSDKIFELADQPIMSLYDTSNKVKYLVA